MDYVWEGGDVSVSVMSIYMYVYMSTRLTCRPASAAAVCWDTELILHPSIPLDDTGEPNRLAAERAGSVCESSLIPIDAAAGCE